MGKMPQSNENRWKTVMAGLAIFCVIASMQTAAAQERSASWEHANLAPVLIANRFEASGPAAALQAFVPSGMSFDQVRFEHAERGDANDGILSERILVSTTPFAKETSLPLLAVLDGGVQVSGFSSVNSMENLLLGLPGAGSLPAWSDTGRSHVSVLAPQPAETYGIALRLHPMELGSRVRSSAPVRWVSRILQTSRD